MDTMAIILIYGSICVYVYKYVYMCVYKNIYVCKYIHNVVLPSYLVSLKGNTLFKQNNL